MGWVSSHVHGRPGPRCHQGGFKIEHFRMASLHIIGTSSSREIYNFEKIRSESRKLFLPFQRIYVGNLICELRAMPLDDLCTKETRKKHLDAKLTFFLDNTLYTRNL